MLFCTVKCRIGTSQCAAHITVVRNFGNSGRETNLAKPLARVPIDQSSCRLHASNSIDPRLGRLLAEPVKQKNELFSAVTCYKAIAAPLLMECCRKRTKHAVTCIMAMPVIDPLEVIDVTECDAEGLSFGDSLHRCRHKPAFECSPVRQTCQMIDIRLQACFGEAFTKLFRLVLAPRHHGLNLLDPRKHGMRQIEDLLYAVSGVARSFRFFGQRPDVDPQGSAMIAGFRLDGPCGLSKPHQGVLKLIDQIFNFGDTAVAIGLEASEGIKPTLVDWLTRNLPSCKRLGEPRVRS